MLLPILVRHFWHCRRRRNLEKQNTEFSRQRLFLREILLLGSYKAIKQASRERGGLECCVSNSPFGVLSLPPFYDVGAKKHLLRASGNWFSPLLEG